VHRRKRRWPRGASAQAQRSKDAEVMPRALAETAPFTSTSVHSTQVARHEHIKGRALADVRLHADVAVDVFYRSVCLCESKATHQTVGDTKRIKDSFEMGGWNSNAGIGQLDQHVIAGQKKSGHRSTRGLIHIRGAA